MGIFTWYAVVDVFLKKINWENLGKNWHKIDNILYNGCQEIRTAVWEHHIHIRHTWKHMNPCLNYDSMSNSFGMSSAKTPYGTVSSHVYAQFGMVRSPLSESDVISKSVVTQCKIWITITPTPTFILISLETLCVYTHKDTVFQNIGYHTKHHYNTYCATFRCGHGFSDNIFSSCLGCLCVLM